MPFETAAAGHHERTTKRDLQAQSELVSQDGCSYFAIHGPFVVITFYLTICMCFSVFNMFSHVLHDLTLKYIKIHQNT